MAKNLCTLVTLFMVAGCSHTIKMYEGKDREPSELAVIYPHVGVVNIGVRYIDDKHLDLHTSNAVVHLLPSSRKVTIVNFFNEFYYQAGQHIVKTTWTMFDTPVELKAGFTYFAWTAEANTKSPKEACLIGMPHNEFVQRFGDHTRVPKALTAPGPIAGCGKIIDASEYVKLHGKP